MAIRFTRSDFDVGLSDIEQLPGHVREYVEALEQGYDLTLERNERLAAMVHDISGKWKRDNYRRKKREEEVASGVELPQGVQDSIRFCRWILSRNAGYTSVSGQHTLALFYFLQDHGLIGRGVPSGTD